MKKIFCLLLIAILIFPQKISAVELNLSAQSAILIEAKTGQVIYSKNPDIQLRPASITKIMTLLLIFDAVKSGKITLEDTVTVSEHAASMGGSQVFLEPGETQTVNTMIKCISIASANDACVAMAEHISGSEEAFVADMNKRAKDLGMSNTNFINCCGLDADGHVTSARDVATMSRELINNYPEIHDYSTIWMDTITHVTKRGSKEFVLNNTNKLIKQYEGATGLKTGSTSKAGFCLSATAKRNDIELISVVMCATDSKKRISDSITLLNYGYSVCSIYSDDNMPKLTPLKVKGGLDNSLEIKYKSKFVHLFTDKIDTGKITSRAEYIDNLKAPIKSGDTVGQLTYYHDNTAIGSVEIVAAKEIPKAGYKDYLKLLAKNVF